MELPLGASSPGLCGCQPPLSFYSQMIVFGLARDRVLIMVCAACTVVSALGGPPLNALATSAANVHVQGQVMVCTSVYSVLAVTVVYASADRDGRLHAAGPVLIILCQLTLAYYRGH